MTADPCDCDAVCRHGERCFAGHANSPDSHWYRCETCSPLRSTVYIVSDGRYLAVMAGCAHAVGPHASARDVTLASMEHLHGCQSTAPLGRSSDRAVERLAWHLVTEDIDMNHPPSADQIVRMWNNPRHDGTRRHYMDRARRYLEIANGGRLSQATGETA